jgi:hypothetical protein
VLDIASNNDTTVLAIAQKIGFNAFHCRLRCSPHMLNLIGQTLLFGKDNDSYDNVARKFADEGLFIIKTPQQYALFADVQRIAHNELHANPSARTEEHKVLEPIKPVVTRWNSYYVCFEGAFKLQSAVNAYINQYIQHVRDEGTIAATCCNKLPNAQLWMRSDGLAAADWQVIAEYMEVLKPFKAATKRLEGRGHDSRFGVIAKIIPVFEYILSYFEQRVKAYEIVDYNAHDKAPKDHLAINLRAA